MAVRYWGIEVSDDRCREILDGLSVPAFEGPDARQVVTAVQEVVGMTAESGSLDTKLDEFITGGTLTTSPPTTTHKSLKQDFFHAKSIDSLKPAFLVKPAIPQIVIYDDVMASFHEESPGGHASLVHSIDFNTRFIYLVDPNAQARRSPMYYSFDDFERGWRSFDQAAIILYPPNLFHVTRSLTTAMHLGD